MLIRIISGVTGAVFVIALLLLNDGFLFLINFLVALVAALSMVEIFNAMGITKQFFITIPSLIFVVVLPTLGYSNVWQAFWYFYTVLMLSAILFNSKARLQNIALVYMLAIVITISLSKIIEIRDLEKGLGNFYVLLALATAWTSDTGAYFFGKFWGEKKLCPEISPQKTVEGVIGGVFVCIASIIFISVLFNNFVFFNKYKINYTLLIFMALFGSLVSALGDLCFSAIKRVCHIKDFGNVIPGHGGILDRFDSVIFVAPYIYLFIKFFPIIS